jgi:pimeloyl-ACP methyl ester carboxylesterase
VTETSTTVEAASLTTPSSPPASSNVAARTKPRKRRVNPLALVALALRAAERVSPALAARLAGPLMFRTQRPPELVRRLHQGVPGVCSTLRVGKADVAITRHGSAGPVVLLIHGWNGFGAQLAAFVPPLIEAGFQVITFDAPGHGDSSGHESSLVHFADALDAVTNSIAAAGSIAGVIAHSFGCAGTAFALDRRVTGRTAGAAALSGARLVFIASPIDIHDFSKSFAAALGLGDRTRDSLDRIIERRLGVPLSELDSLRIAGRVRAPLLIIHDEDDRAVPVSSGHQLAAAWPGSELALTRGLGHNRILRDGPTIARALAFLTGAAPERLATPA